MAGIHSAAMYLAASMGTVMVGEKFLAGVFKMRCRLKLKS